MTLKAKAPRGRVLVSVGIPRDDALTKLERAAKRAGVPLSTYIREAAVARAERELAPAAA